LSEGKWIILAKETACCGGVLPDASTEQGPGTLASFALRNDFSSEGGKVVTVQGTPSPRLRCPKEGTACVFAVFQPP